MKPQSLCGREKQNRDATQESGEEDSDHSQQHRWLSNTAIKWLHHHQVSENEKIKQRIPGEHWPLHSDGHQGEDGRGHSVVGHEVCHQTKERPKVPIP